MNIYVGNLNYKVRESDLQKVMEDYGAVTAVKFIKDRETGRFRGIAFVEMQQLQLKLLKNSMEPNILAVTW